MTRPVLTILSIIFVALLSGCGAITNNATLIYGVAATGDIAGVAGVSSGYLGIANGTVTIEDIAGHTTATPTDSYGNYSFSAGQLSGWSPPYMMRVSYQVGGVTYYLHSIALIADLTSGSGVTINITPLTDLVIANAAHKTASYVFNNFAGLYNVVNTNLSAGVTALDAQLANVQSQFGVPSGVDLFHYSFTADTLSAYDSMLAAVKVTQDPATLTATITNRLTGSSVTDDLTATSPSTTLLTNSSVATPLPVLGDLQAIQTFFKTFTSVMAQTSPASNTFFTTNLANFDLTNFIHNGQDFSEFLNTLVSQLANNPGDVLSFGDIVLDTAPALSTAIVPASATSYKVHFTILNNGYPSAREEFVMYKNSGASNWIAVGNQKLAKAEIASIETSATSGYCSGLQPRVNGASVTYAVITGMGLPANGLLLFADGSGGDLAISSADPATYTGSAPPALTTNISTCGFSGIYPLLDSDIATMATAAATTPLTYTINLYNNVSYSSGTTPVATYSYTLDINALPLTSTQQTTSSFASGESATPSILTQASTGGSSTISWSAPTAANPTLPVAPTAPYLYTSTLGIKVSNGTNPAYSSVDLLGNATSATISVPQVSSAISASVMIEYIDNAFRNYLVVF